MVTHCVTKLTGQVLEILDLPPPHPTIVVRWWPQSLTDPAGGIYHAPDLTGAGDTFANANKHAT
jgi:hypothetical protein